jgi:integrase
MLSGSPISQLAEIPKITQRLQTILEMRRAMKAAGVPVIRFHDLRHTFASIALAGGVPVHVVAKMLGHKNPSVTLNTYSHVLDGQQAKAAERMGRMLRIA